MRPSSTPQQEAEAKKIKFQELREAVKKGVDEISRRQFSEKSVKDIVTEAKTQLLVKQSRLAHD